MKYRVSHTTRYTYAEPVSICHNQVHLAPRSLPWQVAHQFQLLVNPVPSYRAHQLDYFGNRTDFFAIEEPHLGLTITASSLIEVSPHPVDENLEGPSWGTVREQLHHPPQSMEALRLYQYCFPSHHVPVQEDFATWAKESFDAERGIMSAARELTQRIYSEFRYDPRATTISTPVEQVFHEKVGVCQDFAHFQIAALRSLGLAARYVSGYLRTLPPPGQPRLVGADASHAWIDLYCGTELGWVMLDPTNNVIPHLDHLVVGWGRDYQDVCPIQGVFVGGGEHELAISVDVARV